MSRPRILLAGMAAAVLGLASCNSLGISPATQAAAIAQAQTVLTDAVQFYGVAKGIAEVAAVADPTLAGPIGLAIAALDPLVSQASTIVANATADVAAINNLAAQIQAQAAQLATAAAPAIKAVSSVTATSLVLTPR